MKITRRTTVLAASVAVLAAVCISAPIAAADDTATHVLGSQAKLVNGEIIQGWTLTDLKTSPDEIPYPIRGTLWEATATDEALQGNVIPLIFNLNARAQSGQTYAALFHVATPQGVNPATLAQGQKTTGKVYFDVTGDRPDNVVYNAGGQDLLTWVQPAPAAPPARTPSTPYSSQREATPAPANSPATPAAAAMPETPAATPAMRTPAATQPTPSPAGSQGTPLPAGGRGRPLPVGSQGTPLPADSQGTPHLPAGNPGAPGTTATTAPVAPATLEPTSS